MATWEVQLTSAQYTGAFFAAIAIVVFTRQDLNLVSKPGEANPKWLGYRREAHSSQSLIEWMLLACVGITLRQKGLAEREGFEPLSDHPKAAIEDT
jgi:hypothetical protein